MPNHILKVTTTKLSTAFYNKYPDIPPGPESLIISATSVFCAFVSSNPFTPLKGLAERRKAKWMMTMHAHVDPHD